MLEFLICQADRAPLMEALGVLLGLINLGSIAVFGGLVWLKYAYRNIHNSRLPAVVKRRIILRDKHDFWDDILTKGAVVGPGLLIGGLIVIWTLRHGIGMELCASQLLPW